VGTARSHLSKIFDKTGVRHQAELVRLLLDS
jgi:DNA-binding CsgD family transcriptional regulator